VPSFLAFSCSCCCSSLHSFGCWWLDTVLTQRLSYRQWEWP
jgi:hypothetical protein